MAQDSGGLRRSDDAAAAGRTVDRCKTGAARKPSNHQPSRTRLQPQTLNTTDKSPSQDATQNPKPLVLHTLNPKP